MRYKKEEAPRRITLLHKGLVKYEQCDYSNTQRPVVKTPVKAQGKVIGYFQQDHTFTKPVIGSKHQLRRPPAWAIDADAFDREIKPNAKEFVIIDKEAGLEYHCTMQVFDRLKGELDRGFGRQYFLTLKHWEVRNNGHRQLNLWGGGNNG